MIKINNYFKNKKILITGASFIGVHLLEKLIKFNPKSIKIVNLSNKHKNNLKNYLKYIDFQPLDLRDIKNSQKATKNIDIVFHLACAHGGRGYVELKQYETATNFLLDGSIFKACLENNVEKIFYASSGCVYPLYLQKNYNNKVYLKESDVRSPYDADNIYGWAKLMGEFVLKEYYKSYGLKSAIGRLFTVYGPYASETHAVMANIAKALIKQDPFEVWGDGNQIRNWTYVEDIVDGILKLTAKIDDATPINLGTKEKITVKEMISLIFKYTDFQPKKIIFNKKMPVGPKNRVADNSLAKKILNWQPKYSFEQGLKKTISWYIKNKNIAYIKKNLKKILI